MAAGLVGCADPTAIRQLATPSRVTGHWQAAPHLGQELAVPILAPSNPQVAYELPAPSASGNGAAHGFQRTDDGGATWQALPLAGMPGTLSLDKIGGVLRDGSLFADMLPTTSTQSLTPQPQAAYALTLYARKPGDAA